MPTVVTKGPKMPKERPKPNAQRVQKVQNMKVKELKPKKIEKPVGQPTRYKLFSFLKFFHELIIDPSQSLNIMMLPWNNPRMTLLIEMRIPCMTRTPAATWGSTT